MPRYNPEKRWRGRSYKKGGQRVAELREKQPDPDLGSAICPTTHEHRTHYLGGGMRVCFECFVRLVIG